MAFFKNCFDRFFGRKHRRRRKRKEKNDASIYPMF
jgi:hypothetical protein